MATGTLPRPGTQYGPCVESCLHIDCAATRAQAESACVHCGKPIGYDVEFFDVRTSEKRDAHTHDSYNTLPIASRLAWTRDYWSPGCFAHADCEYKIVDQQAAQ